MCTPSTKLLPRKQLLSPIQPETNLGISTISGISRSTRKCSDHLLPAICQKLEFRAKPCEDLQAALARKEARLRALWNTRLSYQMAALPPFEQVFRELRRTFRRANLP
jgi:hypothetical protein